MQETIQQNTDENAVDPERVERRARRFWVGLVVGLLGTHVLIGVLSLYLSVGDASVAVIPNYYHSAVNWDVTRRARELTQELNWTISPSVSQIADDARVVRVELRNASGQPVRGIRVRAEVFHHARGGERYELRFTEISDGVYAAPTSLLKTGLWQVKLSMEGDHGTAEHEQALQVD